MRHTDSGGVELLTVSAWLARGDESSVDDCCSRTAVRHHRATSKPCAQMSRHERLVYNSTVSVVLMCACRSDRHLDVCTHTSDRMIRRGNNFFPISALRAHAVPPDKRYPIRVARGARRTGGSRFVAEPSWPSPSMDMAEWRTCTQLISAACRPVAAWSLLSIVHRLRQHGI